nr:MAG TPA: hypothetical protein [Caudoviricetes sp.]
MLFTYLCALSVTNVYLIGKHAVIRSTMPFYPVKIGIHLSVFYQSHMHN